jgi:hypothetical protein
MMSSKDVIKERELFAPHAGVFGGMLSQQGHHDSRRIQKCDTRNQHEKLTKSHQALMCK